MASRARQLHALYVTSGSCDHSSWASLVKEYASRSFLREAALVYGRSLHRRMQRLPLLPALLKAAASLAAPAFGRCLHAEALKSAFDRGSHVAPTLVSMYCKCRLLADARRVFDGTPERGVVLWNAMLAGYAAAVDMARAETLFARMGSRSAVTWSTMVRGFAEKGDMAEAWRWFEATPPGLRSIVSWTVLVHGYVTAGDMETARKVFDEMPAKCAFVWSSMVTGYFKAGNAEAAQAMFDRTLEKNLVCWNTLISGFAQIGCCEKALQAFQQMLDDRIKPDEYTMASLLSACAQLGSLEEGRKIHEFINNNRIRKNQFILTGLVDMYGKCGDLARARKLFDNMQWRNTECWNSMISALASHGRIEEALHLFFQMECSKQKPNEITFLAVLGACTHGGLVEEGLRIFSRFDVHGVATKVVHYGCLVDLLGRAGKLKEAYEVLKNMPLEPNEVIWGALLGACKVHSDAEMSEQVSDELHRLLHRGHASTNDAMYILRSNILAASERWQQAERLRRKMVDHRVEKTPGCSSVG